MVITIGAPACGKTTWLRHHRVRDVALDDQPGVYLSVPAEDWLLAARYNGGGGGGGGGGAGAGGNGNHSHHSSGSDRHQHRRLPPEAEDVLRHLARTAVQGRSLRERLADPRHAELLAVLRRLRGDLSPAGLRARLPAGPLHDALAAAVEDHLRRQRPGGRGPARVDLYVPESLFRGGGLERAAAALADAAARGPPEAPLGWGNTNTRPREYAAALAAAARHRRPVLFCLAEPVAVEWAAAAAAGIGTAATDAATAIGDADSVFDLRVGSLRALLARSVDRFARTGRYVPAPAILDMNARCAATLREAAAGLEPDAAVAADGGAGAPLSALERHSRLEVHRELCRLAGYEMDDDRLVRPMGGGGLTDGEPQRGPGGRELGA